MYSDSLGGSGIGSGGVGGSASLGGGPDDHSYDVKMIAALDLDHDSRRELWLQVAHPDATTDSLGRFGDTGLSVFAELTCPNPPSELPPTRPATPPRRPPSPAPPRK